MSTKSNVHERFKIKREGYALVTMHRPSNVDYEMVLSGIIDALEIVSEEMPIVFPAHPRTANMISEFGLDNRINHNPNFMMKEPLGYLDFVALMKHAKVVITDSGGLQEETTALGIPCITIRENTERPVSYTHLTLPTNREV